MTGPKTFKQVMLPHYREMKWEGQVAVESMNRAFQDVANYLATLGNSVMLPGLGRLELVTAAPRKGRNPQTGLPITIPARPRLKFTPLKRR